MNKLTKLALVVMTSVGLVGAAQAGMHHWGYGPGPDCPYGYSQDCPYHQGHFQGNWQQGNWQRGHNDWCEREGYRQGYRDGFQDGAARAWRHGPRHKGWERDNWGPRPGMMGPRGFAPDDNYCPRMMQGKRVPARFLESEEFGQYPGIIYEQFKSEFATLSDLQDEVFAKRQEMRAAVQSGDVTVANQKAKEFTHARDALRQARYELHQAIVQFANADLRPALYPAPKRAPQPQVVPQGAPEPAPEVVPATQLVPASEVAPAEATPSPAPAAVAEPAAPAAESAPAAAAAPVAEASAAIAADAAASEAAAETPAAEPAAAATSAAAPAEAEPAAKPAAEPAAEPAAPAAV